MSIYILTKLSIKQKHPNEGVKIHIMFFHVVVVAQSFSCSVVSNPLQPHGECVCVYIYIYKKVSKLKKKLDFSLVVAVEATKSNASTR